MALRKNRLFETIDLPKLFPSLTVAKIEIQKLWKDFTVLTKHLLLAEEQLSTDQRWCPAKFYEKAKEWVEDFVVDQIKGFTPYMHSLAMHVSQFLDPYGILTKFNQQGLEKLNDLTTIYFQHASNH